MAASAPASGWKRILATGPGGTRIPLPGVSPPRPELDPDLQQALREHCVEQGQRAALHHVPLLALVALLLWGLVPSALLAGWIGAIAFAVGARVVSYRRLARSFSTRGVGGARAWTLLAAAAWGMGPLLLLPYLGLSHLLLIMVVFAGLIAGATASQAADPATFYRYMAGLLVPLAAALILHGSSREHWGAAAMVGLFAAAMVWVVESSHLALVRREQARRRAEKSEDQAARERAFLRSLLQSVPNAIAMIEPNGTVLAINPAFERLFGYTEPEVLGRRLNELIVPSGRQAEALRLDDVVHDARSIVTEVERQRKDGAVVFTRVSAGLVEEAGQEIVFAIYDDVTAIRAAEHHLRDAEAKYRQLVESASDLVWQADTEGRLTFVNHMAEEFFGKPAEALLGTSGWDLVHPVSLAAARAGSEEIRKGWAVRDIELTVHDGRGGVRQISYSAQPIVDRSGRVVGTSGISRDITARVRAREALEEARRAAERADRMKTAFLANMSHEIRTPLNGILGMIELLLDSELRPEQRRSAELVRDSGEALLTLLNDILDISKIEAGRLELENIDFDLPTLIESTVRLHGGRAAQQGVELVADIHPAVPRRLRGDAGRIRQIVTNLVGNAVKFTTRGEVVVTVSARDAGGDQVLVDIAVRDTGIGIPPEKLALIFEEFAQADPAVTRKFGGTGLGLAISRRLAALMGGELKVESEVDRGSVFRCVVPLGRAHGEQRSFGMADVRLAGLRVLVVDDSATNRRILRDLLAPSGVEVEEAADGVEGLERVRHARATGRPFDLVIVDRLMPEVDGFQLAERIRSENALHDTRLLMLTSTGQPGDGQRCRDLGIAGYFPKPVSRTDLLEAVAAVVRGQGATGEGLVTRYSIDECRRKLRILLAEDNPVNQQVAATMLRRRGHHVVVVGNGKEAVETARQRRFDVVLMDVQMPDLDGLSATREIRRDPRLARLPVVAVTAHALQEERDRCLAAGMDAYLSKPFKPHELFAAAEGWAVAEPPPPEESETPDRPLPDPPVDLASFRRAMSEAGVAEAVPSMLEVFLRDAPGRMGALEAATGRGDLAEATAAAHAFKSASTTITARRLGSLLEQAERAGRAGDATQLQALMPAIRAAHVAAAAYLQDALAEESTHAA